MSRCNRMLGWAVVVVIPGLVVSAEAALFEVGAGKPYSTIQDAVNAAAALDAPSSASNAPNPSPVNIRIYGGTYTEQVTIPADTSGAFNGANDGWRIESAPGETVWLNGGIGVNQNRDNGAINGIHIRQSSGTGPAYAFTASGNTARTWNVSNGIVYSDGTSTAAGFYGNLMYGSVNLDHMTFYNNYVAVSNGYASAGNITNSIFVGADDTAIAANNSYSSAKTIYSNSLLFGNAADTAGPSVADGGNNVLANPLFASTDPNDPRFLMLDSNSPAVNAGTSMGRWQEGPHIGAMGVAVIPEPASLSLLALGAVLLTGRRRCN